MIIKVTKNGKRESICANRRNFSYQMRKETETISVQNIGGYRVDVGGRLDIELHITTNENSPLADWAHNEMVRLHRILDPEETFCGSYRFDFLVRGEIDVVDCWVHEISHDYTSTTIKIKVGQDRMQH